MATLEKSPDAPAGRRLLARPLQTRQAAVRAGSQRTPNLGMARYLSTECFLNSVTSTASNTLASVLSGGDPGILLVTLLCSRLGTAGSCAPQTTHPGDTQQPPSTGPCARTHSPTCRLPRGRVPARHLPPPRSPLCTSCRRRRAECRDALLRPRNRRPKRQQASTRERLRDELQGVPAGVPLNLADLPLGRNGPPGPSTAARSHSSVPAPLRSLRPRRWGKLAHAAGRPGSARRA